MSDTKKTKEVSNSNGSTAKRAEAALTTVSSSLAAMFLQRSLDKGQSIYIPSLKTTIGEKSKDKEEG